MNLSIKDLEKGLWDGVQEEIAKHGRTEVLTLLEKIFSRAILGKQLKGPEAGYPKVLTKRYRNDNLLSLSERQSGGAAGYGVADRTVNNKLEEDAAIAEGFSGAGASCGKSPYPLTFELSAVSGGAPAEKIIVQSPQEYADLQGRAWNEGRVVTVASGVTSA